MVEIIHTVPNRGPAVLAVTTALLVISTVVVASRLISRIGIARRLSKDDYFIVGAWFLAFGFSFSICYGTSVGLGRHQANVRPEWRMALRKSEYAFSVLYNPTLMATKTSICLFYLTLSKNQKVFRYTTWATLVVVNLAGFALTCLNCFQCRPPGAALKDPLPASAKCTDIVTLYLSSAPVNIITDLAILFLPMPILTSMRLPRNEKLILILTFSFGGFVAVVDVVRIAYLQSAATARFDEKPGAAIVQDGDFSWIASLSFMWSAVEVHVGIICACVPGVKPLVVKVFPNFLGRIKKAREMHGNPFFGPGDAQWANLAPRQSTAPVSPAIKSVSSPIRSNANSAIEDGDMGMIDFLTTPDTVRTNTIRRADTAMTSKTQSSKKSRKYSLTPFDFVNMNHPKSMVKLSNKESYPALAFVTILFFLWGFAYGLLDILNRQFQLIVNTTTGQNVGLHSAYFAAYFVAPLTFGMPIFKNFGFKATFMSGLCVYACGTLVFWPSAVLASYPAFLISNFIVGLGVATLELAGNPFITLCGPPEYAEVRLNISQAVQAIGTVVSPILAKKVLFKSVKDSASLIDVQWTYLGIALFVVILALVFFYVPLPEASDEDLQKVADRRASINQRKVLGTPVVYVTLALGIFSQFCYVGGQESAGGALEAYVDYVKPHSNIGSFDYHAVAHSAFAVGRFLSAFASLLIKPRRLLLCLYICLIVTSVLAMNLKGYAGVAVVVLILFFESGVFSLIFAMSIRGLGAKTKVASVLLTAATSGGAIVPAIMSPVTTHRNNIQYAFCVVVAIYAFGTILPVYANLVPAAKEQVDPVHGGGLTDIMPETSRSVRRVMTAARKGGKGDEKGARTEDVESKGSDEAARKEEWPG